MTDDGRSDEPGLGSIDTEVAAVHARALGVVGEEVGLPLPQGATLGRYVILERIGHGGMGDVYAAYDPELDRKIALKLLLPGLALGAGAAARLLREAQAMAQFSHVNVVTVHDVGSVGGRVFVAMEFVEGGTLRHWMRARASGDLTRARASWREVVEVFTLAGRGLEAAHAAGLIHRDFKPDNVLLGKDGRVRVADFGLARSGSDVLEPSPGGSNEPGRRLLGATLTQAGAVLGTPAYMAPEQARGESADARSDQYSFCVALYEALYGALPDESRTARREGARVPTFLREILLRGLEADPKERYPAMGALLRELGRDASVSRRRFAIAGATFLLAAAGALALYFADEQRSLRCRGAERKLAGVWDPSIKAAVSASFTATGKPYAASAWREVERVLDGYANAWTAMFTETCEATRLRGESSEEVLDLRMSCLSARLGEVRALGRLFAAADAQVVERSVAAAFALTALDNCSDIVALAAPVRLPAQAETRAKVDALRRRMARAKALHDAGKYRDALPIAEALAREASALGYRPFEAQAHNLLADIEDKVGATEKAMATLHAAARAAEAGRDIRQKARAYTKLLYVVGIRARRGDEGARWAGYAAAAIEALDGDEVLLSMLVNHRGTAAALQGRYDEAERLHRRALALRENLLGPRHPEVGLSHSNLGIVLRRLGRAEAAVHLGKAVEITRAMLGAEHPDLAVSLNNLGGYHLGRGDNSLAARLYRESLRIKEGALGLEHPEVADALNNVGLAREAQADYAVAERAHRRALAIRRKAFGESHPDVAKSLNNLGVVHDAQGRYDAALLSFAEARAIYERTLRKDDPLFIETLENEGKALLGLRRYRDALERFEHALRLLEKASAAANSAELANALTGIGESRLGLGDAAGALVPLRRALTLLEREKRAPIELADTRFALARALAAAPSSEEATTQRLAREARAAFAAAGPRYATDRRRVAAWLARRPKRR